MGEVNKVHSRINKTKQNVYSTSEQNWNRAGKMHDTSSSEVGGGKEKRRGWEWLPSLFYLTLGTISVKIRKSKGLQQLGFIVGAKISTRD